jgi:protein-L-isoaspartate O-methyltransferase
MHAHALQHLEPFLKPGMKGKWTEYNNNLFFHLILIFKIVFLYLVLDVGCGSGYLTACFAEMVRILYHNC